MGDQNFNFTGTHKFAQTGGFQPHILDCWRKNFRQEEIFRQLNFFGGGAIALISPLPGMMSFQPVTQPGA